MAKFIAAAFLIVSTAQAAPVNGLACTTSGQAENMTDKLYPYSDCTDSYVIDGTTITLKGTQAPRMFITEEDKLLMVNTKEESVSWTMNMAKLGKYWNGALYMTYVNFTDPKDQMLYCDANPPTNGAYNGQWCYEMDLAEGNTCGFHSTSHGCTANVPVYPDYDVDIDLTKSGADTFGPRGVNSICYAWGNAASFGGNPSNNKIIDEATGAEVPFNGAYGSGAGNIINTEKEFHSKVVFNWKGDVFESWTQTLSQGGKSISTTGYTDKRFTFQSNGKFALLVQLWESKGLPDWLSGHDCSSGSNPSSESYSEMELYFDSVTITRNADNSEKILTFPARAKRISATLI